MTQQQMDDASGITIHLTEGDPPLAICSGEPFDRERWQHDTTTPRKMCQACYHIHHKRRQETK